VTTMAEAREAFIVRMLEDHAHRFHGVAPGSEARYVIETWVKDATPQEWDAAEAFVQRHPEILTGPHPDQAEVQARDGANAGHMEHEAARAFRAGDYDLALYLIAAAAWWLPQDADHWERRREQIRSRAAAGREARERAGP